MINAQQICAEYKIPTKGFFILGLPGETERSANNTIEFSKLLQDEGMDSADFYHLTPYPGTAIWLSPERFGMNIRTKDFKRFMQAGPEAHCIVDTEELKAERIDELVEEAKQRWKD